MMEVLRRARASLSRVVAGVGRGLEPRLPHWGRAGRLGDDLLAQGRWREAAEACRRAIARKPGRFRWHANLGTALSRLERWEEAAAAYGRALELDPASARARLGRGAALARLERWEEAAQECRRAVERDPTSEALVQLGNALLKSERWVEAMAAYDRVLALSPGHLEASLNRGAALLKLERWDEAVSAYRRAVELQPVPEAFLNLGAALWKSGRLDEAAAAYRRTANLAGDSLPAHVNLGAVLAQLDRWDEAASVCRRAAELDPRSVEAAIHLGNALLKSDRWDEAAAAYGRALELDPASAAAHLRRGMALAKLERWEEAASACRRAAETDPASFEAVVHLGDALLKAGRWDEAVSAYDRALALSPDDVRASINRGAALSGLGRWEWALAACGRAARLAPGSLPAHSSLATVLMKLERWDEAVPVLRRATELDPAAPGTHANLGIGLLKLERWEEAAECFRKAVELRPGDADSQRNLGEALSKLERWEEAASAHRRCASIEPGSPGPWLNLAGALSRLGRLEEAAAACGQAVAADPADAAATLHLGTALCRLERWEEAAAAFREGTRLAPDNAGFHFKLAEPLAKLGRSEEARAARERATRLYSGVRAPTDEAVSAELQRRAATFWTPGNLGAEVFRAERWIEGLASVPGGDPVPSGAAEPSAAPVRVGDARLLFVLDDDYGELTTLMYLVLGQDFARRATLLLPDRLYASNADALPGRTGRYGSPDDVLRVVDAERPHVAFLLSAYLYSVHGNMSLEALERLVELLRDRGCRVVTGDPFLGMLSRQDPRTLVEIDLPQGAPASYREAKAAQEALLHTHLPRSERILRRAHHLYPAFADVPASLAGAPDARNVSFFNPRLLLPDAAPGEGGPPRANAASDGAARPHWLFILSMADFHTQTTFESHAEFAAIVVAKLVEAREAGRHPILIGPGELVETLIHRMPRADGVDVLRYCSFRRLISLLLTAEYAFYWNAVSHSLLIRLFNRLPVILFDKGHLVRNVRPMYRRVVDWYYQGWEPKFLDHRRPLALEVLEEHAADYRRAADRILQGFRRAMAPEEMIQAILDGSSIPAA